MPNLSIENTLLDVAEGVQLSIGLHQLGRDGFGTKESLKKLVVSCFNSFKTQFFCDVIFRTYQGLRS
jgi:hypothetical protein